MTLGRDDDDRVSCFEPVAAHARQDRDQEGIVLVQLNGMRPYRAHDEGCEIGQLPRPSTFREHPKAFRAVSNREVNDIRLIRSR
jgi:hypothetical protein